MKQTGALDCFYVAVAGIGISTVLGGDGELANS